MTTVGFEPVVLVDPQATSSMLSIIHAVMPKPSRRRREKAKKGVTLIEFLVSTCLSTTNASTSRNFLDMSLPGNRNSFQTTDHQFHGITEHANHDYANT